MLIHESLPFLCLGDTNTQ